MDKSETKKHSFSAGPWPMKEKDMKNFLMVTTLNRPTTVVLGRILYVIERVGRINIFKGVISIDPCFTRGKWKYPWKPWQKKPAGASTHFVVGFPEDMNYEEWARDNKNIIDKFIKEEQLYIKPSDPILVYFKE